MKGIFETACEIARQHAQALRDDPTLAAHLDAHPGTVIDHANKLVDAAAPKGLSITFAPYIPHWWLKRLFDEAGLKLRNSLADGGLVAELTPEVCATLQAETVAAIESDSSRRRMMESRNTRSVGLGQSEQPPETERVPDRGDEANEDL